MLKIQLEELEIFITVSKSGSFTKAADALSITSSVVSKTVKKLENKLKTTLFNRTTRKVILTQEGEWLLSQANSLIQQAYNIESHLGDKHGAPAGKLTVDAATPFALHALGPLIAGFNSLHPDITITLQASESIIDLIDRKVDVAIRIGELEDSSLKARKLGECFRYLYASPDYLAKHGKPKNVSQLSQHMCLGFDKPQKLNTWPIASGDEELTKIQPSAYADSGETLKQLAIKGCGIVCISSFTAEEDVEAGRLVTVLEKQTVKIPIPVYAVFYSDNEVNNRLRCFLDYISEHIVLS